MLISLDPDEGKRFVGPNCFQSLLADDTKESSAIMHIFEPSESKFDVSYISMSVTRDSLKDPALTQKGQPYAKDKLGGWLSFAFKQNYLVSRANVPASLVYKIVSVHSSTIY